MKVKFAALDGVSLFFLFILYFFKKGLNKKLS